MASRTLLMIAAWCFAGAPSAADEALYRYEGNVPPDNESAGWLPGGCEDRCTTSVQNSRFVLELTLGKTVTYTLLVSNDLGELPLPPTLWVEWRFRSNQQFGGLFETCDGTFVVRYRNVFEPLFMFGDTTISFDGGQGLGGLDVDRFNTYRFESLDGVNYRFSVDGTVLVDAADTQVLGGMFLQMIGSGGCEQAQLPTINEWDFVRYGTISLGETIVNSDPPAGFVDARKHGRLDRFTVTFDSANYIYVDDIAVEVTGGAAPLVAQTRHREND